ncbi:MAG: HEAT repeat domain-containing protein [Planctomycetes bacterium]|nr:HEAT repeat domain-containing protein [Planctomycetota bacterium]
MKPLGKADVGCSALLLVAITYPLWSHLLNVWLIHRAEREADGQVKALAAGDRGALEVLRELGGHATRVIRERMDPTKEPDPRVREAAAEALGWVPGSFLFAPLEVALHDTDPGVRKAAASTVGLIGRRQDWGDEAVQALLQRLDPRVEPEEPVRRMAAYSLGQLGSPEASPALVVLAMNVTEPEPLRIQACDALAALRDPRTVRALVALVIAGGEVAHHAGRALALTTGGGEGRAGHGEGEAEAEAWESWWEVHGSGYPPQILFEGQ